MRYRFRVEYDGTAYHGWQRQSGDSSVQESLERAFTTVTRLPCQVVGAGRTDAGVHARRLGAHVDIENMIDPVAVEHSVNGVLPPDIAVSGLALAPPGFHARYSATQRHYCYHVVTYKAPLLAGRAWQLYHRVDWDLARLNLAQALGTHDFSTMQAAGSSVEEPVCTISRAALELQDGQWVFFLSANRFVYRMVRSIVGTVVEIGRGAVTDSLADILASRDRRRAGPTAPACGLVLDDVTYGEDGT